ncbi:MAG TPA: hypothetical protein VN256_16950 [Pyrinomonadaceae bacterium]|nr:hypothetical protein [Pyrinomonadaceae bacterium]
MRIVYATCSPRHLEFFLTDRRESVPAGATVFAICTGDRTLENQDEDLFAAITDDEYQTLRRMVCEAERLEQENRRAPGETRVSFNQFFGWMLGVLARSRARAAKTPARRIQPLRQGG